jgi:hypothetical protein
VARCLTPIKKLADLNIVTEVTGRVRDRVYVARDVLAFVGRELGAAESTNR